MTEAVRVVDLQCEYLINPMGIDTRQPRLTWKLAASRRGVKQTAYQVQVAADADCATPLWDTDRLATDDSASVLNEGFELAARQRYFWRVRVWDETGVASQWSPVAWWEMGLLAASDWQAQWIEPQQEPAEPEPPISMFENLGMISPGDTGNIARLKPCQYLRKEFDAAGTVARARIYATAHGVYRLYLNGARVGDLELAPEVTAYDDYLQYQTYDVTELLRTGANALGAVIGDGWWCGRIGLPGASCQYGDRLALLLQLEIDYEDGSRKVIASDGSFKSSTGPLVYSDLFIGERYDAGLELGAWCEAAYDDSAWTPATVVPYATANLVAQYGEPLRVVQELTPLRIITTPKGETVLDLGQNISGKLSMRVRGPARTEVVLDYAEMLDADGNFMQQIRGRNKDQRDVYLLKGGGAEVYEPWFTSHGFRYVRLSGYPGAASAEDFRGLVVASDLQPAGRFVCSDAAINRLQENILWSQRGNFVSVPTDCPQRERAGFTGDAQIFAPTACFNMDVAAFFTRWLRNLRIEQRADGQVPTTVPYWQSYIEMFTPIQGGSHTSAGWGDACIIIPWTLYQVYGDARVLAENYTAMVRWLDYVQREAETGIPERLQGKLSDEEAARQRYLWNTGFHFGDWLIPSLTAGYANPFVAADATKEIAASCFYAGSTALMSQIAGVLGKVDAERRYAELNGRIRAAFAAEYLGADGSLPAHYQGMYVLALKMNMIPEERRTEVVAQLAGLIAQNNDRLDTGFVSVPYLLDVLGENGCMDVAFRLLLQTECPSWLYAVKQGATTIWETWDAVAPDGTVNLASFNHYAFGCVGDWLYRTLAGLDKDAPGYKRIRIEPRPHGSLTFARASFSSVHGEIISGWELQEGQMRVEAVIPPNTSALIRLPGASLASVQEGGASLRDRPGIVSATEDGGGSWVEVGSGSYSFEYPSRVAPLLP